MAWISPSGPTCSAVLRRRASSSRSSVNEPATRSIPSSRAMPRAQRATGPSSGSAAAIVCSGVPSAGHFSGSTTSSAPACAAARVSRSAVSRLRSRSGVDCSCTAAARTRVLLPHGLTRQSIARLSISCRPMPLHKSWRWVGAFGPDLMLCAATAQVGVLRRSWWAVWDGTTLHEGTRAPFALALHHGTPIEATTGPTWTRKTPLRVRGTVLGREIDLPGLLDESSGRHPRRTSWLWSAGAGVNHAGEPVVWNLVDGMHEGERTVWVGGVPHHVGHQPFDGLHAVGDLKFSALATRA